MSPYSSRVLTDRMRFVVCWLGTALVILLTLLVVIGWAHAGPVTYTAAATFHALDCKWGTTFNPDGLLLGTSLGVAGWVARKRRR